MGGSTRIGADAFLGSDGFGAAALAAVAAVVATVRVAAGVLQ